jgi:predicted ATPase
MIIKSVIVDGFWERAKAVSEFYPDVTIFIGVNGTGKTTFINLISAALTVDVQQLENLQFNNITIILIDPKRKSVTRKITINNYKSESPFTIYEYKVGNKKYRVYSDTTRLRRIRMPPSVIREMEELKSAISNLVEVSWISVYRQVSGEGLEENLPGKSNAIDTRLKQLLDQYSKYQLKLETQLNEISLKFQREAISSLLYNPTLDDFNLSDVSYGISKIDLEVEQDNLFRAFNELGIKNRDEQIESHVNKLRNALKGLSNSLEEKTTVNADDVFALPLVRRTNQILDLLKQSEKEKQEILEPRRKFYDTLLKFMTKKNFYHNNKTGELVVSLAHENKKDNILPLYSLSSGEKKLLIQFMEVLLQEDRSLIFIADEPELSLHVSWQAELLKALRDLNRNAQLIVATHSPEIVAGFTNNVIDMEDIVLVNA